jgi:hypothetical protein
MYAYMHAGLYVFPRSSRAEIANKYKANAKCHVVSKPEFNVLSNGALAFAVSLILCTGKWI